MSYRRAFAVIARNEAISLYVVFARQEWLSVFVIVRNEAISLFIVIGKQVAISRYALEDCHENPFHVPPK